MVDFYTLHNNRRSFIRQNIVNDHIVLVGKNKVLLSAPHGVSQVRLGRKKAREIGSITTALYLKESTNCFLIAKTRNNFDDANFDEKSAYKDDLVRVLKENNVEYLLDIHGLAENRGIDINLGTNFGANIKGKEIAFDNLYNDFKKNGFIVTVDNPFMAGGNTIASFGKKKIDDLFFLQIEINCGITNKIENFDKYKKVLEILKNWIENT